MKAIHYDAEGDILTVTFGEPVVQNHTGIELNDNIVLYYNPETSEPLKLILISYQAMVRASEQVPIPLDGLARTPAKVQATVTALLSQTPLTAFLRLDDEQKESPLTSQLLEVFTPSALQMVAAGPHSI